MTFMKGQRVGTAPRAAMGMALLLAVAGAGCADLEPDTAGGEAGAALTFENWAGTSDPFVIDASTQCANVGHCCPGGMAMVGIHERNNLFKCAALAGGWVAGSGVRASGSRFQRHDMLACPEGTIMWGYFAGNAVNPEALACAAPKSGMVGKESETVDSGTQDPDNRLHVCPDKGYVNPGRYAMAGFHRGRNRLLCTQ